jgi:peptidoglycan/LPS O-acetylase OafA/YrhL
LRIGASYRRELDGLRALAVLPVMLFHAEIGPFSGGYVGVDIFFVISGFLITGIIYREVSQKEFSYLKFYERRARRIFPALYFVLFVSIIPAWFFLIPSDYLDFSENIISTVGFSSNIVLWQQLDYFSQASEMKPLLHTWSLAVEEQYYVFFPILLMVLYRHSPNNIVLAISIILLASLALSHWGAYNRPSATYYLLPTRAWELLIGSVIALLHTSNSWRNLEQKLAVYAEHLSFLSLLLIVTPIFIFDENTPFPSLWAVLPTAGTALFILFAQPTTTAYSLLSNRFFVGIGLISYSAYLWHQPVYAFARQQTFWEVSSNLMMIAFVLSITLAYLTWKYVEQPFRNRDKISAKKIWILSGLVGLFLAIFGLIGILQNGFEDRFNLRQPLTAATFDLPKRSNGWCFYSVDANSSLPLGENGFSCKLGAKQYNHKILLFGDSYAGMYEPFWDVVGKELSVGVNSITTNWCHPSFTENFWWTRETTALNQCLMNRKFVSKSLANYDVIVVSAVWTVLADKGLINEVKAFIGELTDEHNIKVIVMAQPPVLSRSSVMRSVYNQGKLIYGDSERSAQAINAMFKGMAFDNHNLLFVDRGSLFETGVNGQQILTKDAVPYSWDGGHISVYGSLQAGSNFVHNTAFNGLKKFIYSSK